MMGVSLIGIAIGSYNLHAWVVIIMVILKIVLIKCSTDLIRVVSCSNSLT